MPEDNCPQPDQPARPIVDLYFGSDGQVVSEEWSGPKLSFSPEAIEAFSRLLMACLEKQGGIGVNGESPATRPAAGGKQPEQSK
jgi:hypothetical protein